ncbi:glycoside hydrolase family 97 protein [Maribacter polysaccharolyticus]|uniref:glycoside hydrolase family 97 protein n=1 Tax=Maribacter polysaccharolyticus TaxID=3020831 RepID=UPI00237F7DC5|nr:glycoside hydrolase family 97 protein [Maribacter polysaccharolyticus]MDE3743812.1 glycoside hydrolase family 97 protein [Maribacter polysaccharolyticus]
MKMKTTNYFILTNVGAIKAYLLILFQLLTVYRALGQQEIELSSPNEKLKISISLSDDITWKGDFNGSVVISHAMMAMDMGNGRVLGKNPVLRKKGLEQKTENHIPVVPNKDSEIRSIFNELTLNFKDNYQLVFRAYNDGMAYRFIDGNQKSTHVYHEEMALTFPQATSSYFPEEESFYSHNERNYQTKSLDEIENGAFCSLPVLFDTQSAKVLFTESALIDYPGMFLAKTTENTMASTFPKYVLKAVPNEGSSPDRNQIIEQEADFIARVDGKRSYPWRVFIISDDDRTFVESNLVTILADTSKITDTDWIKPGQVAWDWYNANNIYGVDFKAGLNMETYKYYIDFASKNGIEYVILDEGWTKSTTEILEDNEFLDVPDLIKYAKSKNVDIILWVLWKPLYENPDEILKLYSSWGAVGIKVDFMQRSDQYVVDSYGKIAEIAAKYKLMVDYHGAFKPAGVERLWPNIVNYEAVRGNENNKWTDEITPEHNVTIPFIRMAAGPMDYTPGAMINMNQVNYETGAANFAPLFTRPMSFGTRAHQVAMYIVYEAPLQMLCESPTIYYKEQETVDFITSIPTVWDETIVLEGAVADYIVIARRNGDTWYIGAMTDWTPRDFEIELSFLGEGTYTLKTFEDGINASRNAQDYKTTTQEVYPTSKLNLELSSGGGYSAIITKK